MNKTSLSGHFWKSQRQFAGWTQRQVADALSVSKSVIAKLEKGCLTPPATLLGGLIDLYKISDRRLLRITPMERVAWAGVPIQLPSTSAQVFIELIGGEDPESVKRALELELPALSHPTDAPDEANHALDLIGRRCGCVSGRIGIATPTAIELMANLVLARAYGRSLSLRHRVPVRLNDVLQCLDDVHLVSNPELPPTECGKPAARALGCKGFSGGIIEVAAELTSSCEKKTRTETRYVVAHELGHILLHGPTCVLLSTLSKQVASSRGFLYSSSDKSDHNALERHANLFARSLLVPLYLLNRALVTLGLEPWDLRSDDRRNAISKRRFDWPSGTSSNLPDFFGVSTVTMSLRLGDLRRVCEQG